MEVDSALSIVSVPYGHAAGHVTCRFTPSQTLTVFRTCQQGDCAGENASGEGEVYEVTWQGIIWNQATRKLITQSHAFFTELQQIDRNEGAEPKEVLHLSQLFRSALHECVIELQKMAEAAESDGDLSSAGSLTDQVDLYSLLEVAWHLCEILFVETLPQGCLIQQLLEWVHWHDQYTQPLLQYVLSSVQPENSDGYWRAVFSCVLQGRMEEATQLLQHLSLCRQNPEIYRSICELLQSVPMLRPTASYHRSDLKAFWHEWRRECHRRYERGDFVQCHELQLLCGLLCGEESCFKDPRVMNSCHQWYQLMVGHLLYCSPLVISSDYDLQYTAENCLQQYCREEERGALDRILLTALQNNAIDTVKLSSSLLSDWWFVAHLVSILHYRGTLVASQLEYGSKLSEHVLVEYASSLVAHPAMWQVAVDYFSYCPRQGRHFMSALVERIPLTTERKALKVIRVCQLHQLTAEARSICRVLAVRAYRRGRLGNSLTWCIRAKDKAFAALLADKYFEHYQNLGEFQDLELLDHLGEAMLLSDRLTFLGKYRELQRKYRKGDFVGAGQLLVSLLGSGIVPKRYWSTFLIDSLPLLEIQDKVIFNSEQTHSLMHFLYQVTTDNQPSCSSSRSPCEETMDQASSQMSDKLSLLQLALTRNLQCGLLEESTADY